jgi:hypothetical protein
MHGLFIIPATEFQDTWALNPGRCGFSVVCCQCCQTHVGSSIVKKIGSHLWTGRPYTQPRRTHGPVKITPRPVRGCLPGGGRRTITVAALEAGPRSLITKLAIGCLPFKRSFKSNLMSIQASMCMYRSKLHS